MTRAERAQLERQAGVEAGRQVALERELSRPEALILAVNGIGEAINNLADAIREVGSAIAEEEPLNFSIARGLDQIAESLKKNRRED